MTISSFIKLFQSRVVFHIEISLLICNQMTGFYVECTTGLKWIKQYSQTTVPTLTSMSCFGKPLLVLETKLAQFLCCCDNLWLQWCWRQWYYLCCLDFEYQQFDRTSWNFQHHDRHQFSPVFHCFEFKLMIYKHVIPKINKA